MTSTSMSDPALAVMAQADVLLLLASLFRQPSEETAERLRFAVEQQDDLLINAGSRNRVAWCRHLATVASQLAHPGLSRVSASHNWLFDGPTYCPINETGYIRRDKGAILADIAGFYRAFGFEPKPGAGEKADHLVSELEFVAMLLVMMGNALEQDRKEDAETCLEALRKFASDHLGEWLMSFCDQLEETADLAFYHSAGQLLRATWARLSSCHDLAAAETLHEPKRDEDTPYECGLSEAEASRAAPEVGRGVRLTERAAKEVHEVMRDNGMSPDHTWLRVGAKGGGCSGLTYVLDFDQKGPTEFDVASEMHGVKLVIDKKSDLFIGGTTVDFDDSLLNRGFKFQNPLAVNTCGCGTSFSASPSQ